MNYLLGVVGKPFADLTVDEFAILMAIMVICGLLVMYAVSVLLNQLKKISAPQANGDVARSLKAVGTLEDYRGFTD